MGEGTFIKSSAMYSPDHLMIKFPLPLLPVSLAIITWIIHSRIAMQLMTERKSNSGLDLILGRKCDDNIKKNLPDHATDQSIPPKPPPPTLSARGDEARGEEIRGDKREKEETKGDEMR